MKKVLLIFGIAAFSSASAQQKDLFDIQKHLEKKQAEGKKAAEENSFVLPLFKKPQMVDPFINNLHTLSYTLPNGDVVLYGNGTMPCVKPDMSQFQAMPNLADNNQFTFNFYPQKIQPGQIPNGSRPFSMIISK